MGCSASQGNKDPITSVDHKELKASGHALFSQGKYKEAINQYSKAIIANSTISIYYSNRGLCYYKLKDYQNAFVDGSSALKLDGTNFKGLLLCVKSKASQALLEGNIENFNHSLAYCEQFKEFYPNLNSGNINFCKHLKRKIKSLFHYIEKKQKKANLLIYYSKVLPNELLNKFKRFIDTNIESIGSLECPLTMVYKYIGIIWFSCPCF